jgi:alanyl-tRNA synthetase
MTLTSDQIRRQFIDFFVQKHGHTFVPSSPVVPQDDPTLLFTNAGMNQFKPIFLGTEKRPYTRAANTQKCIRAGGKHNDLDDVGRSRRHHTFFEMLGNWSFGDYFKQGAIEMAWELLTKVWKLDPTRLHVSCFEGDEKNGVPRDTEAADIWKKVAGLPDDHIHYFGKDNFWEMGETGPCGPCTEIYIDRTPDKTGGPEVNGNDPRVMEIWNLVFIQYNRNPDRTLTVLPSQHVDTGMGFERITQVIEGVDSNYSIDLWHPFWEKLKQLCGHTYSAKFPPTNSVDVAAEAADEGLRKDIAFRVIADHVRALTFAITDGAVPSNEGRGSVLRRILRRAAFFGRQHLKLREVFLHDLVNVVVSTMGEAFPELRQNPSRVQEIVKEEELAFDRTIDRGLQLFADFAEKGNISGKEAFELHATYGFPIDLTRIIGAERGVTVDKEAYDREFEEHIRISQGAGQAGDTRLFELPPDVLAALHKTGVGATDDSYKFNAAPIGATVKAIWDGHRLIPHTHGAEGNSQGFSVILDRTCFYAEMGGQVGDTGELRSPLGAVMAVETTRSVGGYVLHVGKLEAGHLTVGDHVTATLAGVRPRTEKNHTSTHLANWALREVFGDGIQQKGSLVDPDKLRFDFSHGKALADDELAQVETLVAQSIEKRLPVYAENAPQEQALKINGLRAVFGEKYPPMVRVVSIGAPVKDLLADPLNSKWRQFSIEFCGGTHLKSSDQAEGFAITAEESVSKGIRRIVALTGDAAKQAVAAGREIDQLVEKSKSAKAESLAELITALQKASAGVVPLRAKRRAQAAVTELQARQKAFEKSAKAASASALDIGSLSVSLLEAGSALGPAKLIVGELPPGTAPDQLLAVVDSLKKRTGSYAILLGAAGDGKVNFVAAVSDDIIAKGLKAGDWIREAAKATGGGGGGRPQLAQAGGKDPAKLPEALKLAKEFASQKA